MTEWFGKGCAQQCAECIPPILTFCCHKDNQDKMEGNCREDICPFMHQPEPVLAQQITRASTALKWYKEEIAKTTSMLRKQAELALGLKFTSSFMEENVTIIHLHPMNEEGKLIFKVPKSAAWAYQWLCATRELYGLNVQCYAIDIVFDCIFIGELK